MSENPPIMITGVGRRYDIVASFAQHTTVIATETSPLAPAQYAAQIRALVPSLDDPTYVPELVRLCEKHQVAAVIPLIDPDIEVLARARADGLLPALVPDPDMAAATFDKYETHLLLEHVGLPSPPTVLAGQEPGHYPVIVKPRRGSGSRSIFLARDREQAQFFVDYAGEPTVLQRAMNGPEFSIDCLCDLDGRCLNAIPRSMIESRGGESVKGTILDDRELIELGRAVSEAVGARGACMVQCFRDPELGLRVTDVNIRFGGGYPSHMYGALAGHTYPELIIRMARGERVEPHVGQLRPGVTFARYYWQLELDEQLNLTGREIIQGSPQSSSPVHLAPKQR
ncbi:MAG: ATP-grasp domain-containing protein [Solirubrobacteraceae bacterium]